jgi:hypothetical protein
MLRAFARCSNTIANIPVLFTTARALRSAAMNRRCKRRHEWRGVQRAPNQQDAHAHPNADEAGYHRYLFQYTDLAGKWIAYFFS